MINRCNLAYFLGLVLLIHSGYSSYEWHQLLQANNQPFGGLPIDIILETLIGMTVVVFGSILSIKNLSFYTIKSELKKPATTYLKPIELKHNIKHLEEFGVDHYEELVSRLDFINITEKREEYADWISRN